MSTPIPDIVKMLEQVPSEYASRFSQMLNSLLNTTASITSSSIARSRKAENDVDPSVEAVVPRRRVPFIPHPVPRGAKVADVESEEETPQNRMSGPR